MFQYAGAQGQFPGYILNPGHLFASTYNEEVKPINTIDKTRQNEIAPVTRPRNPGQNIKQLIQYFSQKYQILNFMIVGGIGYAINMLTYWPLTLAFKNEVNFLGQHFYLPPFVISSLLAITSNYILNKVWTFKGWTENRLGSLRSDHGPGDVDDRYGVPVYPGAIRPFASGTRSSIGNFNCVHNPVHHSEEMGMVEIIPAIFDFW